MRGRRLGNKALNVVGTGTIYTCMYMYLGVCTHMCGIEGWHTKRVDKLRMYTAPLSKHIIGMCAVFSG